MENNVPAFVLELSNLINWVRDCSREGDALHCDSKEGRTLNGIIKELCEKRISAQSGVYAWINIIDNNNSIIYVGMTGEGRGPAATLRWRLREELRDERAFLWRTLPNALAIDKIKAKWTQHYPGRRSERHLDRSLRKSGATHVVWTPTPDLSSDQIRELECWLILQNKPRANKRWDRPRTTEMVECAKHVSAAWGQIMTARLGMVVDLPLASLKYDIMDSSTNQTKGGFAIKNSLNHTQASFEEVREKLRCILHEQGFDWYESTNYGWILGRKERWDEKGVVFGYMPGPRSKSAFVLTRGDRSQQILWDEHIDIDQLANRVKQGINSFCTNNSQKDALEAIGDRVGYWPQDYAVDND